jgi:hypothetical protein
MCAAQCPHQNNIGVVHGTFREHFGKNIQGTFRAHSGNIQGRFRQHSGNIQFELRWTPVSPYPNCKKHFKKVPWLTHSGNIQGTFSVN